MGKIFASGHSPPDIDPNDMTRMLLPVFSGLRLMPQRRRLVCCSACHRIRRVPGRRIHPTDGALAVTGSLCAGSSVLLLLQLLMIGRWVL